MMTWLHIQLQALAAFKSRMYSGTKTQICRRYWATKTQTTSGFAFITEHHFIFSTHSQLMLVCSNKKDKSWGKHKEEDKWRLGVGADLEGWSEKGGKGGERKGREEERQQAVLVNVSPLTPQKGPRLPPSASNNLWQTHTQERAHAHTFPDGKRGLMLFQQFHAISRNPSLRGRLTLKTVEKLSACWRIAWVCVVSGAPYVPRKFVFTPKKAHPCAY